MRSVAENVVFSLLWELLGDDGAGGHVIHDRNLGFLEKALRSQCHAGVDVAHRRGYFFFADQLLGDLHTALVFGFVVALNQQNLPAQNAARFVDFSSCQANAVAHADAH